MVKKESVVVKQQPKSVRSPSLPPMTLPLNLTATTSNPTNGSSAVIGSDFVFYFFSQYSQKLEKRTRPGQFAKTLII